MKKKIIAFTFMFIVGLAAVSLAGQSCVYDAQCGYNGVCVKRQGHFQGYCSN